MPVGNAVACQHRLRVRQRGALGQRHKVALMMQEAGLVLLDWCMLVEKRAIGLDITAVGGNEVAHGAAVRCKSLV